jgi:hypothetical protein
MMKIKIAVLLLGCFSVIAHGQGTLEITFDGPPIVAAGTGIFVSDYSESGMLFQPLAGSDGFGRHGAATDPRDPDDGTAYLQAPLGSTLMFGLTDRSVFDVVSVDLAEYSTVVPDPVTVQFIGYHVDGSTVTTSFTTDGIIDGTGPLADFQTFYFDSKDWSGLTHVEIPSFGWSLDNLVVTVPEPSAGALLLVGALTLGALRWRKRSSR